MKYLLGLFLVTVCATAGFAEDTHWQGDPAGEGNWFDPANWTNGIPTITISPYQQNAWIANGGTATIHAGDAKACYLVIGKEYAGTDPENGYGALIQTGGNLQILWHLTLSSKTDAPSSYSLIGGTLDFSQLRVGGYQGKGLFTQVGGSVTAHSISMSATLTDDPNACFGTYKLIGGQLATNDSYVGTEGRGNFIQIGGIHDVSDKLTIGGMFDNIPSIPDTPVIIGDWNGIHLEEATNLAVINPNPIHPSNGQYELQGGQLIANNEVIENTGVLRHSGGQHIVDSLKVNTGGKYAFSGGSLEIHSGLDLNGELNLEGSSVEIQGGGILNFSKGQLLNSRNASIQAGSNSLTIFASDFDPATQLRNFQTDGLVHITGNDLIIQTDDIITGCGFIDDYVETSGIIVAPEGKGIDLNEGLFVREGVVDLGMEDMAVVIPLSSNSSTSQGNGQITIHDDRSGIDNGFITARTMKIGNSPVSTILPDGEIYTPPTATFRQNGGTVNLGSMEITRGTYELRGGIYHSEGSVRVGIAWPTYVICENSSEIGELRETNDYIDRVISYPGIPYMLDSQPSSTLEIHGGSFSAHWMDVYGSLSEANVIQTAGDVNIGYVLNIYGYSSNHASYTMHGGNLTTEILSVGSYTNNRNSTFAILDSSSQIHTNQLEFNKSAVFVAVPDSTIHIVEAPDEIGNPWYDGPSVQIVSTDAAAMAGLSNLTLVYECGLESVAVFEVAGEDRGVGYAGFFENFALDTLQIGSDEDDAYLQLIDEFNNQLDWDGDEVLYVENLILAEGSTLDLNGLNLYCLNCTIEGTLISGGGTLYADGVIVEAMINPEPTTAGLLILGGLFFLRRKRTVRSARG
ncbi:MAG: PEP-CTERM sorting domain-containing protein [Phycisphaerae bacterium]|nr:PEP-CTERM sorting domain-containing protein [Phycisphaerae bacterium]